MALKKEDIEHFQVLYFNHFGTQLEHCEAVEKAEQLLSFVRNICHKTSIVAN